MATIHNKPTYFRFVGYTPNFNNLKNDVLCLQAEEWARFTFRQRNIVGHRDTLTIPLIFDFVKREREILHPQYDHFEGHLNQISKYLAASNEPSMIKRANLVLLKANCSIDRHIDKGEFLESTRRFHLPIVSTPECIIEVDGELCHFPEGQIWELNNTGKYHSVHNGGIIDRIHLIIDTA